MRDRILEVIDEIERNICMFISANEQNKDEFNKDMLLKESTKLEVLQNIVFDDRELSLKIEKLNDKILDYISTYCN